MARKANRCDVVFYSTGKPWFRCDSAWNGGTCKHDGGQLTCPSDRDGTCLNPSARTEVLANVEKYLKARK